MFTAKQFRARESACAESLKHTVVPSEIREFRRSKESFAALAENEDWLADNFDKMVHSSDIPFAGQTFALLPDKPLSDEANGKPSPDEANGTHLGREASAQTEEHILRCLGAAVIMEWNTIPTRLQRELFDTASSMGEALKSVELRGQIARFLHKQKDEEGPCRPPIHTQ